MINQESRIKINGKIHDMEGFIKQYAIEDMDQAIYIANSLIRQGKATEYEKITPDQSFINEAMKRENKNRIVDAIDREEAEHKQFKREAKLEGNDLINIGLNFATTPEALTAENWINEMGIENTEIIMKKGAVILKVSDISPDEYGKISRKYKTERAINNSVAVTSKAINSTTDAINYGATNIVAPIAKIGGEAALNLGKGVVHTGIRVGAGLINSSGKAVRDTTKALQTDPEMLRATKELRDAKDSMTSYFKKKLSKSKISSGINIL